MERGLQGKTDDVDAPENDQWRRSRFVVCMYQPTAVESQLLGQLQQHNLSFFFIVNGVHDLLISIFSIYNSYFIIQQNTTMRQKMPLLV